MMTLETGRGEVTGVTCLGDGGKTFIVCAGSDTILVYDEIYEAPTELIVDGLRDPHDIVACRATGNVYVADGDFTTSCVWRVSSHDGEILERIPSHRSQVSVKPRSLSMRPRRLLITSCNALLAYDLADVDDSNAAAVLSRQVVLPDYIDPQHAVETIRQTFVVCFARSRYCTIVEVDLGGVVLRGWNDIEAPCYLATRPMVDGNGLPTIMQLFVADVNNYCVLTVPLKFGAEAIAADDSGTFRVRVLLEGYRDRSERPQRLCYVMETGILLVGEVGGSVKVYAV
jgi:hypothetical protein